MNNKIEQIIGEIEDYIESCKYQSFSNTKIIVNKDELEDLLSELRRKTPDAIISSRLLSTLSVYWMAPKRMLLASV